MTMSTDSGNPSPQLIGRRILLSRRDLNWNQEELGKKSGVSRGHIAKMERGEVSNPSIDVLFRLADALGVSRAYLLGFTEDPLFELPAESESETANASLKQSPTIERAKSPSYRTLGAELLDIFDQLSTESQNILLAIADKLRNADEPRREQEISSPSPSP